MDELIFPSFPIISALLFFPFNHSTHHPVFGNFHRIKLTTSREVSIECLCVYLRMLESQFLADMETIDWFSKFFHTFEELLRLLKHKV